MAIWESYGPNREELRDHFEQAAAAGHYLLWLQGTTFDVMAIRDSQFVREVSEAGEAFEVLKELYDEGRGRGNDLTVIGVFGPDQSFEEGYVREPENSPLGDAVRHFNAYREQCEQEDEAAARPVWKRVLGMA